jgi:hypothetical protein
MRVEPGALLLLLSLTSFCAQRSPITPIQLVPADAVGVVQLRWSAIQGDPIFGQLTQDPVLASTFRELGLAAAMILSSPGLGRSFTSAARSRGWPSVPVDRWNLYQAPGGVLFCVALAADVLAPGTRDAVQREIEMAQAADATFVNRPDLLELRGFFDSGDPVVVVLAWPPDVRNASNAIIAASAGLLRFAGWGPVSSIVDKLGIGRALAARLARESTGVRANFAGVMQDQETAQRSSAASR